MKYSKKPQLTIYLQLNSFRGISTYEILKFFLIYYLSLQQSIINTKTATTLGSWVSNQEAT